jgi:hypothetical protein
MDSNGYLYCTLAREKIESWLRETEQGRIARATAAGRAGAGDSSHRRSAPRATARRLFWTRWGVQLASTLRHW